MLKQQLTEVIEAREVYVGEGQFSLRQTEQAGETLTVAATPQATIERVNMPDVEEAGCRKGRSHAGLPVELG